MLSLEQNKRELNLNKPFFSRSFVSGLLAALAVSMPAVTLAESWSYRTDTDKMTSKEQRFGEVRSDNSLSLSFPYSSNSNYGYLTIRNMKGKDEVLVFIQKGQILCPGYGDGCTVTARFDQAPPVKFNAIGPSDHSSEVFFIRNASSFIASASKAKKILVQFTVYNEGSQVLEFSPTTPLVWGASVKKK
jgi:hypothetical protein